MMGEENKKAPDSRLYSLDETVKICLQDRPFYEESGGGVTLSGGEALTQPGFAAVLLETLRKEGIHTAIETSGCAPASVFEEVTALADLLLFDIKHYDDRRHVEGTGVHNGLILENLKNAMARGKTVLARLPVIPGYNDSPEDARAFASLLGALGLKQVQLLPFHQFGERKYDLLNLPYAMRGVPQLHEEDLEEFRKIISETGIDCFI
jgi:pyruvate formate lyase activating enzyme